MDAATLIALQGSIEKWEALVADPDKEEKGVNDCPLCAFFYQRYYCHDECPVKARTGQDFCKGSPYSDWIRASDLGYSTDMLRSWAQTELNFLISLLPRDDEMGTITGDVGTIGILNVGHGDTKLSFNGNDPAECIRASRIVRDMLQRGYALLIEVERDGHKIFTRVHDFDENTYEYIIADLDPDTPTDEPAEETKTPAKRGRKRVAAKSTRGVSIARTAGG